jgi:hypothetical protein
MFKQLSLYAGAAAIALTGYVMLPVHAADTAKAPANATAKTDAQVDLIEVKVCPVMHSVVHGKGIGSEVVGKYKVYFCCKGCPEAFDKLTPAQKLQKAQEAYIIQQHHAAKDMH